MLIGRLKLISALIQTQEKIFVVEFVDVQDCMSVDYLPWRLSLPFVTSNSIE